MKITLIGLSALAFSSLASAQVFFNEDFDSLSVGTLTGQGSWLTQGTVIPEVVASGGSYPAAHSGNQMLAENPGNSSFGSKYVGGLWSSRDSGNDILSLDSYLYIEPGDSVWKKSFMAVVGNGPATDFMGIVGVWTLHGKFVYGSGNSVQEAGSFNYNAWNHIHLDIDTVNETYTAYGNEQWLATEHYQTGLKVNTATLYGINDSDGIHPTLYDDFSVGAVPEPCTMMVLGVGALVGLRRGRKVVCRASK